MLFSHNGKTQFIIYILNRYIIFNIFVESEQNLSKMYKLEYILWHCIIYK